MNPTTILEDVGSDHALLWCRLAAPAPIHPLAWEPPYAMGVTLKRPKKKKDLHLSQYTTSVFSVQMK